MKENTPFENIPASFILMMNDEKEISRKKAIDYIIQVTGLEEIIQDAKDEDNFNLKDFIEKIYDIGYYDGVSFIMNFDEEDYEDHYMTESEKFDEGIKEGIPSNLL